MPNTQPFPTNQTATVVNHSIDGIFKVTTQMAEAALVGVNPAIFGNPLLEKIDNAVIELVANAIYKQFSLFVTFEIIDFQTAHEVSDYKKALIVLKAAQKAGNQNEIVQALAEFQKACIKLTVIDGAAHPGNL